ncbi:MAG: methyltransferase [Bacteroidota bacterium]
MHSRAPHNARIIAPLLDFKNVKVLLDVGGGSGDFSFEFIRKNKNLKAVVFDLPNVTQITEKYIAMEGMEEIVKTVPGDYLTDEIGEGYDLAFLSAVIHSNSPDENKLLFKKCFNALNNKGQIVILDYIMDDKRTEPLMGALFALNMLVGTDKGDTYTEKEISSWMKEAGFKRIKKITTPLDTALMIGSR